MPKRLAFDSRQEPEWGSCLHRCLWSVFLFGPSRAAFLSQEVFQSRESFPAPELQSTGPPGLEGLCGCRHVTDM